ncbi:dsRBD fold-containing protein [Nonomuraea sp. NPDC046570]|uniref:dsRBD fold-containing protein n=1 Tax=Nonomuraea sp. NPDC046570 TaxID=3155255 RepID=UPI0033C05C60
MQIDITESGSDTSARAVLTKDGTQLSGEGHARCNPADSSVPEIGDELAVSRALADLAEKLGVITQHDIAESVGSSHA